jgi:uncharacterized alpha-E superfamily protein
MLSRVASLIYWMARYLERADNGSRILDAESTLALDHGHSEQSLWRAPLATAGDLDSFLALHGEPTAVTALQFLLYSPDNANSVLSCLSRARDNARGVRETLPSDVMSALNRIYWQVREASGLDIPKEPPSNLLEAVRFGCALVQGLCDTTLSRGEAWHFIQLGRMLERADQGSRLIDVKFFLKMPGGETQESLEESRWLALLRSASALEMYRRKQGKIIPLEVARFLIYDPDFPRSLQHCLNAASASLEALYQESTPLEAKRRLGRLRSEFLYAVDSDLLRSDMHAGLDRFQAAINGIDDAIHDAFFNPQSLGARRDDRGVQESGDHQGTQQQ